MKIAIHNRSGSFSDFWIEHCKARGIPYKVVNAYDSDIIEQLSDCDAFMWHFHHAIFKDTLLAKHLLSTLQMYGKVVFPDIATSYTFDDKVAQKYQLEAIGAPVVPSYVFYGKEEALSWAAKTTFPKVFKLKGGAGASNVKLIHNRKQAELVIRKAFKNGFKTRRISERVAEQFRRWKSGQINSIAFAKAFLTNFRNNEYSRFHPREAGYVYFQDFIPGNNCDWRVIVADGRAFGLKRNCREGDFRASGSGSIEYLDIPEELLEISFKVADRLKTQSLAIDYVFDDDKPLIVELSFGYTAKAYLNCGGYYTRDLKWQQSNEPQPNWYLDAVMNQVKSLNK